MRVDMGDVVGDNLLMGDLEGLLREIGEFSAQGGGGGVGTKPEDIPPSLDRYLQYVAKSGNIIFPWHHVRNLFRSKIIHAMNQFPGEVCQPVEDFVLERFDLFRAAPFTIQRMTELILQPTRHYKKKEKFLRGLEKTVLVVSTVEPWSLDADMNGEGEDEGYNESVSDESIGNRTYDIAEADVVMASGDAQEDQEMGEQTPGRLQPSSESSSSVLVGAPGNEIIDSVTALTAMVEEAHGKEPEMDITRVAIQSLSEEGINVSNVIAMSSNVEEPDPCGQLVISPQGYMNLSGSGSGTEMELNQEKAIPATEALTNITISPSLMTENTSDTGSNDAIRASICAPEVEDETNPAVLSTPLEEGSSIIRKEEEGEPFLVTECPGTIGVVSATEETHESEVQKQVEESSHATPQGSESNDGNVDNSKAPDNSSVPSQQYNTNNVAPEIPEERESPAANPTTS